MTARDDGYWAGYCEAEAEAKDAVLEAVVMIKAGRVEDGVALLERNFFPAWEDVADCEARYREVMAARSHSNHPPAAQAQEAA